MNMVFSEASQKTHEALEVAINNHFRQIWIDNDALNEGDVILEWTVVIHVRDLDEARSLGQYVVETSDGQAPHHIKGLLAEGIDWVVERQENNDE